MVPGRTVQRTSETPSHFRFSSRGVTFGRSFCTGRVWHSFQRAASLATVTYNLATIHNGDATIVPLPTFLNLETLTATAWACAASSDFRQEDTKWRLASGNRLNLAGYDPRSDAKLSVWSGSGRLWYLAYTSPSPCLYTTTDNQSSSVKGTLGTAASAANSTTGSA